MKKIGSLIIDASCLFSLVGIWPRYIEPKRLKTTYLEINLPGLNGLKIVHLSDLHFYKGLSFRFLEKIAKRVQSESPDLIFFTGDFICFSQLEETLRLKEFLCRLPAKIGAFCTFGNHDYATYVTRNQKGDYVVSKPINPLKGLFNGLSTLFQQEAKSARIQKELETHKALVNLLKETPFTLLENESVSLPMGLNIVGLGDYAAGRFKPEEAFKNYDANYPGIVLTHNPDTFPKLLNYPGSLILAGHSHGEQIHFPYPKFLRKFSQKLTRLEYPEYSRGFFAKENKMLYVNRGLGCHKPLRLFSPPEILVMRINPC